MENVSRYTTTEDDGIEYDEEEDRRLLGALDVARLEGSGGSDFPLYQYRYQAMHEASITGSDETLVSTGLLEINIDRNLTAKT